MKRIHRSSPAALALLASLAVAACEDPATPEPLTPDAPEPQMAVIQAAGAPDLGMARLTDLRLQKIRGGRLLLRYSTTIVNVGSGPFELYARRSSTGQSQMAVVQRVYDASGGWSDVTTPAVVTYSGDGHDHWHVRDLQSATIRRLGDGAEMARSEKRGFCFWDNTAYRLSLAGAPSSPVYGEAGCGEPSSLEVSMGQSVGWGDIYPAYLPDQYIDVSALPSGTYRLVVTADPAGWFSEANTSNNATWVDLEIRGKRLRVLGYGPAA